MDFLGVVVVIAIGAMILWARYGELSERRFSRSDTIQRHDAAQRRTNEPSGRPDD